MLAGGNIGFISLSCPGAVVYSNQISDGTGFNTSRLSCINFYLVYIVQLLAIRINSLITGLSCIFDNFASYGFSTGAVICTLLDDGESAVFVDINTFYNKSIVIRMGNSKRGNLQETDTHGQDQDQRLQTFGRVLHDTFS